MANSIQSFVLANICQSITFMNIVDLFVFNDLPFFGMGFLFPFI